MTPHFADDHLTVLLGDVREVLPTLPAESVHCVVTSPPYWGLRDYGVAGQLGLEPTPEEYVANMVEVFREVRRVLRADGTVWLNLGDSYAAQRGGTTMPAETLAGGENGWMPDGSRVNRDRHDGYTASRNAAAIGLKHKDLVGIPWRVAFALQADGWYLRSDIIWSKPNPMPESVTDRPTKAHEYVFLLTKSARYYFDAEAVREPAQSGPSDLRKMAEGRERIGGLVKEQDDPKLAASGLTNIGRKRSVGGAPLKQDLGQQISGGDRMTGFNGRWDAAEADGTAPAGRNLRSVWTIATQPYPGAHFATFPEKLVEPCVKAGTTERGVCPECGAPWVRVVERTPNPSKGTNTGIDMTGGAAKTSNPQTSAGMHRNGTNVAVPPPATIGWKASCHCCLAPHLAEAPCADHYPPVPATVLDPFAGSGTTARVANRLGRRAILIELKPDYIDQAMLRNVQAPLGLALR